jgi:HEAT repeat protein
MTAQQPWDSFSSTPEFEKGAAQMTTQQPVKNKAAFACVILSLIAFCGCETDSGKQQTGNATAGNPVSSDLEVQATQIIQQALANSNPQVRANAIEKVAGIPISRARKFMPEVQQLLKDEFVPVKFAAAVAIGDTGYSQAQGDITQLLKDDNENVRIAAAYAAYKLGSAGGLAIIHASIRSKDQTVRANAAVLIGKSGESPKRALPLLYETIRDETSDDKVMLCSIEAIARLGDETIYQKLWAMLISEYADDRVCGVRAMGALGTSKARDSLLTMLKDDMTEIRLVAAEQLGNLGDTSGEKVVIDALAKNTANAPDQEAKARIQTLAALAIGQIRTPTLKKFLPELLKSEFQFARLAAAKAILQYASDNNIGRQE